MKIKPWFNRKFTFDLPEWSFPNVVERLRSTPAAIQERITTLPSEILIEKPRNRWSIQENFGHLLDLEPLWLGRVFDIVSGKERMRPADLENRKTHEADHNATPAQELAASFRKERFKLVESMDKLEDRFISASALHPRLDSPMRMLDLVFFVAEHDDHHMACVTAIARTLING